MSWRDLAACAGSDPDWWTHPPDSIFGRHASAVCAECPVIDPCTTEADTLGTIGIRGRHVLTEADLAICERCGWFYAGTGRWCGPECEAAYRAELVERMRHGARRYNHGCRCEVCTAAQTAKKRRWRAKRAAAKMTTNTCGVAEREVS